MTARPLSSRNTFQNGDTMAEKIGAVQMAVELGMRRPSAFGDESYIREIIAAYNAKHGGADAPRS